MLVLTKTRRYSLIASALLLFVLVWELFVYLFNVSEFLLPRPSKILETYLTMLFSGQFLWHTFITAVESLSGFVLGAFIGIFLGYLLAKSGVLEKILSPFIIAAQTTPKLALAPLFLIWFGFGILSKIFITALVVFFPIFVNMFVAIKSVNPNLRDLMSLAHADNWQVFNKLELPSSLPMLFAGFKSGITLAIVGAVVGEFVGASAGLGYLIIFSMGYLDTPMVFAAILQLVILGFVFYKIVSIIGSRIMNWHESEKDLI